ncbi:protein TolR [Chitinimonas taiwanensis]|jgi:biopolymer transport protein TolR|uniref:Biopolymer transport protein TolR n=1 Tax=Chitinimonas taiwanensis DSM 18899 TaxID=1121279 RepID=A0A1K2H5E2_9NEIS|nr:protein TolR [Chitinimonas taiwanensis]SFZ70387.1 biopolymer transport protein TolR [Chitinimonas taiwanensis DSM 18899]
MARRPRRIKAEINVVPYIDVMLVLLVIFMVAAPMLQPGVVNLPSVDKADRALDIKPIRVEIDAKEALTLADGGEKQPLADAEALVVAVKARTLSQSRPVVITADKEVRYDAVIQVMNALKKNGVERVGLAVQPQK